MRNAMQIAVGALVVLGAAGCGGDNTKTVTVSAETVTRAGSAPATTAPSEAQSPQPSAADGKSKSAGPPLRAGEIGIDGRYLLKQVQIENQRGSVKTKFASPYEERSIATTECVGTRCSVAFRLGLESGGYKPYTLEADPGRKGTYIGTSKGQAECSQEGGATVPTQERVALRGGSVQDIDGRKVAGRLSVFITTTAPRCGDLGAKVVALLRGPRE